MAESNHERLRKAIMAVVEQQIRAGDPPVTGATYARLRDLGYSSDEAKRLIGLVVGVEFFGVLRQGRKYDAENFARLLDGLPRRPWEGNEGEE